MKRLLRLSPLAAVLLGVVGVVALPASAATPQPAKKAAPVVQEAVAADRLPSLAALTPEPITPADDSQAQQMPLGGRTGIRDQNTSPKPGAKLPAAGAVPIGPPASGGGPDAPPAPPAVVNVEGISFTSCGNPVFPPDTNGAAGPDYYVQLVNTCFQVYDKAGNSVFGPTRTHTLWNNFGAPCATLDGGDGIVLYDRYANRFVVSQLQYPGGLVNGPWHECVAVSVTANPLGAWNRYDFTLSNNYFQEYPKLSVWPDGYYLTTNQYFCHPPFGAICDWKGAGVFILERDRMLPGKRNARSVYFDGSQPGYDVSDGGFLPSDLDGPILPPAGAPNTVVGLKNVVIGNPQGDAYPLPALRVFQAHADWANPGNASFNFQQELATQDFNPFWNPAICRDSDPDFPQNCVSQPNNAQPLEALTDRLLMRLQYRNFGDHASLVTNHTIDVDPNINRAGIRWYELTQQSGQPSWSIFQQGTFAPPADQNSRWFGSIAQDVNQNISLGYSIVNGTNLNASINDTGRTADDPLGTMPQDETRLITGGGQQTNSGARWGDYSDMVLDPLDDCTFWYTTEYNQITSSATWHTRIGAFRFPDCGSQGTR